MISILILPFQTSLSPLYLFLVTQYEPHITAVEEKSTVKEKPVISANSKILSVTGYLFCDTS